MRRVVVRAMSRHDRTGTADSAAERNDAAVSLADNGSHDGLLAHGLVGAQDHVVALLIEATVTGALATLGVVLDRDDLAVELSTMIFVDGLLSVFGSLELHSGRAEEVAKVVVVELAHDELADALEQFLNEAKYRGQEMT